jgi:hypothetical protein
MLAPPVLEENILKVLAWLNENSDSYPLVGQRALDAAKELEVSFAEVNTANRRIKFGLVQLEPVKKPKKPVELKKEVTK